MTTMIAGLVAIGAAAGALALFVFCVAASGHESRDAQLYRDLTARSAHAPSSPWTRGMTAQTAARVAAARHIGHSENHDPHLWGSADETGGSRKAFREPLDGCAFCGSDEVVRAVLIVPVIDEQTGTRARERWCLNCAPLSTGNWQRPGPVEVWGVS